MNKREVVKELERVVDNYERLTPSEVKGSLRVCANSLKDRDLLSEINNEMHSLLYKGLNPSRLFIKPSILRKLVNEIQLPYYPYTGKVLELEIYEIAEKSAKDFIVA